MLALLAYVLIERGAFDEARSRIDRVIAAGEERGLVFLENEGYRELAFLHLAKGELDEAVRVIDRCAPLLARTEGKIHPMWLALIRAEAEFRRGRRAEARAAVEEALARTREAGATALVAAALRIRADLAVVEDALDDAARDLDEADGLAARCPAPVESAYLRAVRAKLLAARGDATAAAAERRGARADFERCGVRPYGLGPEE